MSCRTDTLLELDPQLQRAETLVANNGRAGAVAILATTIHTSPI